MAKKKYKIGIDIGGTKMLAILFDGDKVVEEYILATPKDNIEHFTVMISALVEPLFERARKDKTSVSGIGLGVAGVVDYAKRVVTKSPNIRAIEGVDFISKVEKNIGFPINIDNDANCSLRAEISIGAAKKYDNASLIVIGTGIGSAWWHQGQPYVGVNGSAGEIGHNIVDIENKISLEQAYQKLTQRNALNMSNEAYRGDLLAQKSFEEFGEILGISLANLVNTINPGVIVLYGGGTGASDLFLPTTKKTMKENIWDEDAKKTKIVLSKLEGYAGAIGAAMLVE